MNSEEKTAKLEQKIAELRQIYANEIHDSWTQGHQKTLRNSCLSNQIQILQKAELQKTRQLGKGYLSFIQTIKFSFSYLTFLYLLLLPLFTPIFKIDF